MGHPRKAEVTAPSAAEDLAARTAKAVAFGMKFALPDAIAIARKLAATDLAEFLYAYFRVCEGVVRQTWTVCVAAQPSLDAAARVFGSCAVTDLIRHEVASRTLDALHGDSHGIGNFAVGPDGVLYDAPQFAAHTSFSREHPMSWEMTVDANYTGSKADIALQELGRQMRAKKLRRSRMKAMGVKLR